MAQHLLRGGATSVVARVARLNASGNRFFCEVLNGTRLLDGRMVLGPGEVDQTTYVFDTETLLGRVERQLGAP